MELGKSEGQKVEPGTEDPNAPEQFSPAEASLLAKAIRQGLVETKQDVEIQQRDPTSPLYSVKTFEALQLYELFNLRTYRI